MIKIFVHQDSWIVFVSPSIVLLLPPATQSSSDATDFSGVDSTPLGMTLCVDDQQQALVNYVQIILHYVMPTISGNAIIMLQSLICYAQLTLVV